jgi:alkaline phosphatase
VTKGLGIADPSSEELALLATAPATALYAFADMVSRRSQTGWSTHGHSAADVNIYSSDARAAAALVGNHENTEVGQFLSNYLDVDVKAVTDELREKGAGLMVQGAHGEQVSWMGKKPDDGARLDGQTHLTDPARFGKKKRHALHSRDCGCEH